MLQLLNPIWLFGIAGILIPIAIHLWNVKPGKTLRVGSIMLMGESSRQNSRSFKLSDLLLLFLRCLLIVLLSLILTEPNWKVNDLVQPEKNWVLVERDLFQETYQNYKEDIDSLVNAGSELRLFNPDFQKVEMEDMLMDSTSSNAVAKPSYWGLIRLMQAQIPPGAKAYIFSGNKMDRFKGSRPQISVPLEWKTFTPSDSVSGWIENSFLSGDGKIIATIAESKPSGSTRKTTSVGDQASLPGIKSKIEGGKVKVEWRSQVVDVDTSTLKIAVHAKGFAEDSKYVVAAINALQTYTQRKIKFVAPGSGEDILFWLSEQNLPEKHLDQMKDHSIIFQYGKGKRKIVNTWIESSAGEHLLSGEKHALNRRIEREIKKSAIGVWEDGFGEPVLDLESKKDVSVYTFYSRFDPEWTETVWSDQFVKLLLPLLNISKGGDFAPQDNRSLANMQFLPVPIANSRTLAPQTQVSTLSFYIWILLMLIFTIERFLSFHGQKN